MAASIAQALADAGLTEGSSVKPSDMLRFGMGLGITLGANGLLQELDGDGIGHKGEQEGRGDENGVANDGAGGGVVGGTEASLAPPVVKVYQPTRHRLGKGMTKTFLTTEKHNNKELPQSRTEKIFSHSFYKGRQGVRVVV